MSYQHRLNAMGLGIAIVAFVGYWVAISVRAVTDNASFTDVAWQGPMLWAVIIGGGLYGAVAIVEAVRMRRRGERVEDIRDREIDRYAGFSGRGLLDLVVLAAVVMLAVGADTFWTAHVLFVGAYLASLISTGATLAAYSEGIPS